MEKLKTSLKSSQEQGQQDKGQDTSEYVTLASYQKLKKKYKAQQEENLQLRIIIDDYNQSFKILTESHENTKSLFNQVNQMVENLKKEAFCSPKSISDLKTSSNTRFFSDKDHGFSKKFDEMELAYAEMFKQFNLLMKKYLCVKEEKEKIEDTLNKVTGKLNKKLAELKNKEFENSRLQGTISRFREIDNCLLENAIKTYILNTKKASSNNNNPEYPTASQLTNDNKRGPEDSKYIICEPVPSIIKFIGKNSR